MWVATLIGAILGFKLVGVFGALLGGLAGNLLAKGLVSKFGNRRSERRQKVERVFFTTVFSIMGYLAKSDGRVSEEEIAQAEGLMAGMNLRADQRKEAIRLFKAGTTKAYSLEPVLLEFRQVCGSFVNLSRMLLVHLVGMALADGVFDPAEERILRQVAQTVGFSPASFEQLIHMIRAQDKFGRNHGAGVRSNDLALAYQALGVEESATEKTIKQAYRRLMSEYHPDKLIGQGVPEAMVKVATERAQEVQAAYDLLTKRGKSASAA